MSMKSSFYGVTAAEISPQQAVCHYGYGNLSVDITSTWGSLELGIRGLGVKYSVTVAQHASMSYLPRTPSYPWIPCKSL